MDEPVNYPFLVGVLEVTLRADDMLAAGLINLDQLEGVRKYIAEKFEYATARSKEYLAKR